MIGLSKLGLPLENVFLVAIPYSAKQPVLDALRRLRVNVWQPGDYPFERELREAVQAGYEHSVANKTRIAVVEDGGYVVPLIHQSEYAHVLKRVSGAVEQTANGIWIDQELDLKIPVINIAQSQIKADLEAPLIGQSVVNNISRLLQQLPPGESLYRRPVLVVGMGSIGLQVAEHLVGRPNEARLTVYDVDGTKREAATAAGFQVIDGASLLDRLKAAKIIIGCTGKVWLDTEKLLSIGHNAVVVSASSKRMEVDWDALRNSTMGEPRPVRVGKLYPLASGNTVALLADGLPVNFFDNDSVPNVDIQFINGLLAYGTALASCGDFEPGIVPVAEQVQNVLRKHQQEQVWGERDG